MINGCYDVRIKYQKPESGLCLNVVCLKDKQRNLAAYITINIILSGRYSASADYIIVKIK